MYSPLCFGRGDIFEHIHSPGAGAGIVRGKSEKRGKTGQYERKEENMKEKRKI
jgi:hypothetical protein